MAVHTSSVAGIVSGRNPLEYESGNPITLFLFQAIFIVALCQIVHIPLGYIKQPRVIAEVISGILLGPSVMGHIPKFTTTCFPTASIPSLTLVANIGVILFLFLVGLEVDIKFIKKNYRTALSVGLINMAIPFGFGCAVSVGLYHHYVSKDEEGAIKFSTYLVFIAVAMCITAFPVLARILTELRLLKDRVGTIVLAAGITNDVVGWILLALSVTLANSGSGVNTVYILLITAGWGIFIIYPARIFLRRVIMKKDLQKGSLSRLSILSILILVFISSFFTDIIGVHPIFGAFLVGLIVPREHGFVVDLTNKIEDLVHLVLIPIYFALAGFKVNLGDLNQGIDWGYIIALISIAVVSKIFGGFVSAKMNGLFWRESLAVGVLMSCKGIVEIVVLSVGLNAEIISQKVFSMFVVMTLVSTFLTTPLTLITYPVSYREKVARYLKGEIDWEGNELEKVATTSTDHTELAKDFFKFDKVIYNIETVDELLTLLDFIRLFYGGHEVHEPGYKPAFNAVLLKELTERTSDLIGASTILDEDKYNQQLELLKKIFEFNDVTYLGDVKYYSGSDEKLPTFLESSFSSTDLMIYSTAPADLESKTLESLKNDLLPNFGLLVQNVRSGKTNTLTISFANENSDTNLLILYLAQLFLNNTNNLHNIKVLITDGEESDIIENHIAKLSEKAKVEVTKIYELSQVSGFFMTSLDLDNILSLRDASVEIGFNILAVRTGN